MEPSFVQIQDMESVWVVIPKLSFVWEDYGNEMPIGIP